MLLRNRYTSALMVCTLFETYLRPCEALHLTVRQVVRPNPQAEGTARFLTLVARAQELQTPSKTGEYDVSIPLDLSRQKWLANRIRDLCQKRGPHELLFRLDYLTLVAHFREAVHDAQLTVLEPTVYCLRHGGASHDVRTNVRTLEQVQLRGQWKAWSSMRRYQSTDESVSNCKKCHGICKTD